MNALSPYELIKVGPECLLDEIMNHLEPKEVDNILGVPVKVCKWLPQSTIALFNKLGGIELIIYHGIKE